MKKTLFKKILVGFAFSPNLKANIFTSLRLADSLKAEIFFIHVGKKTSVKKKTFEEILEDSPVQPKLIKVLWEEGGPIPTILKMCKKNKIDLLLLGAVQRENVLKFYVGSIAREITRKAPCSVLLLIKPSVEEVPSKHVVVNAINEPNTEKTIRAAFEFSSLMGIPNVTLVGEISQSKVNVTADDDESLKKVTEIKEGIENEEKNRYDEILLNIPDGLKENKKIHSQSIFGARGYSIGHYARVVRADLLVLNSEMKRSSFISRIFPKDMEHILSELPTDVLIIKN
ncbi:MAG: universal stress protein [Flavobacteriales bacterium]|nr:MAG: universal stress protein [Flavobacteriales bacterium]